MTIEEKLQHFYESAVGEAKKEADLEIDQHRRALAQQMEAHKEEKRRHAEQDIKAEIDNARREVNKALSAEQLVIKRNWSSRQKELKEKLFAEVQEKLEAFMASPAYEQFLEEKVKAAGDFAQGEEIHIYVSPSDASRAEALTAATGYLVEVAEESFLGGIQATIPSKNILIDNSFLDSFMSLRKEFTFEGGLHHE